jgi:hypothetical protein
LCDTRRALLRISSYCKEQRRLVAGLALAVKKGPTQARRGGPFSFLGIDLDVGFLGELAPLGDFAADESGEFRRGGGNRFKAGGDAGEGVLAQAIISLGHSLDLKVIAEGVETDDQVRFLAKHRCDEVQGFYYGEPAPPDDYAALLARNRRRMPKA